MHEFNIQSSDWNQTSVSGRIRNLFRILKNIPIVIVITCRGEGWKCIIYVWIVIIYLHIYNIFFAVVKVGNVRELSYRSMWLEWLIGRSFKSLRSFNSSCYHCLIGFLIKIILMVLIQLMFYLLLHWLVLFSPTIILRYPQKPTTWWFLCLSGLKIRISISSFKILRE